MGEDRRAWRRRLWRCPDALDRLGHRVDDRRAALPRRRRFQPHRRLPTRVRLGHGDATTSRFTWRRSACAGASCSSTCRRSSTATGMYGERGVDYPDNAERFGAAGAARRSSSPNCTMAVEPYDVVHAHDWQAGLVPAFLRTGTGRWPRLSRRRARLHDSQPRLSGPFLARRQFRRSACRGTFSRSDTAEFWGKFSFLKAGITYSDFVTTVSPTYARETLRPSSAAGMEGVLHSPRRTGTSGS